VARGLVTGPRLQVSVGIISHTGGHADSTLPSGLHLDLDYCVLADDVPEVRKAARRMLREGADVVKICTSGGISSAGDDPDDEDLRDEEIAAVVDEARRHGGRPVAAHAQGRAGVLAAIRGGVNIAAAIERKVNIAAGTDAGIAAHGRNLAELPCLVELGMSPMDAIRAATANSAHACSASTTGSAPCGRACSPISWCAPVTRCGTSVCCRHRRTSLSSRNRASSANARFPHMEGTP
jgi:imidazolonepropionase-like amidohydrolase